MSDTSIKQFFYLAAKNLFGLKISREEFEQSKHENFDLSENLKYIFDDKKIKNNSSDIVSDKKELSEYMRYQNITKKQTNIQNDSQDSNDEINEGINTGHIYNSSGSPETIASELNDAINYLGNQLQNGFDTISSSVSNIISQTTPSAPPPAITQTTPSAPPPPVITQITPEEKQEFLTDSDSSGFTTNKKENSPVKTNNNIQYYKSLVNNIFPGYFDIESENSIYNMEGGENETEENQEMSKTSSETQSNNLTQQQILKEPKINQDNKTNNELSETFASEKEKDSNLELKGNKNYYNSVVNNVFPSYFNMDNENSEYMKGGEGEENQLKSTVTKEIKKEDEKEFEDKIITTTDEKKQNEDLIIVNPNKTEEKINNINVSPKIEKQETKPINPNTEINMKGGELTNSSISQNTQNIILNAFNELTDKKKNNLF